MKDSRQGGIVEIRIPTVEMPVSEVCYQAYFC